MQPDETNTDVASVKMDKTHSSLKGESDHPQKHPADAAAPKLLAQQDSLLQAVEYGVRAGLAL